MPVGDQSGKVHPAIAALIVIVLVGVVASVVIAVQNNQDPTQTETTQTTQEPSTQQPASTNESSDVSTYKNGTYSATGSYITPGGRESIELSVTIENGVITATELGQNASDRDARRYQSSFAGGYADLIVGKDVDEVSLSRVAGSSLTSNGFNDALEQIKEDAAA